MADNSDYEFKKTRDKINEDLKFIRTQNTIVSAIRNNDQSVVLACVKSSEIKDKELIQIIVNHLLYDCYNDVKLNIMIAMVRQYPTNDVDINLIKSKEFKHLATHEKARFIAMAYVDHHIHFISIIYFPYIVGNLKRYDLLETYKRHLYGNRTTHIQYMHDVDNLEGFQIIDEAIQYTTHELLTYLQFAYYHYGGFVGDRVDIMRYVINKVGAHDIVLHSDLLNRYVLRSLFQCRYFSDITKLVQFTPQNIINDKLDELIRRDKYTPYVMQFILTAVDKGLGDKQIMLNHNSINRIMKTNVDENEYHHTVIKILYKRGMRFDTLLSKYATAYMLDCKYNVDNEHIPQLIHKRTTLITAYKIVLSYAHMQIMWSANGVLDIICSFIGHRDIFSPKRYR